MPSADEFLAAGGPKSADEFLASAPSADDFLVGKKESGPGPLRRAVGEAVSRFGKVVAPHAAPFKSALKAAEYLESKKVPALVRARAAAKKYIDPSLDPLLSALPASALIPSASQSVPASALDLALIAGPEGLALGLRMMGARRVAAGVARAAEEAARAAEANKARLRIPAFMRRAEGPLQAELGAKAARGEAEKAASMSRVVSAPENRESLMAAKLELDRRLQREKSLLSNWLAGRNYSELTPGARREYGEKLKSIRNAEAALEELGGRIEVAPTKQQISELYPGLGSQTMVPEERLAKLAAAEQRVPEAQLASYREQRAGRKPPIPPSPSTREAPPPPVSGGGASAAQAAAPRPGVGAMEFPAAPAKVPNGRDFVLNPNAYADKSAQEAVIELAKSPEFSNRVIAQKGGRVPIEVTRARADRLLKAGRITPEMFRTLTERQVLSAPGAKMADVAAAGVRLEEEAFSALSGLMGQVESGALPVAQAAEYGKSYLETAVGSLGMSSEMGRALATRKPDVVRTQARLAKVLLRQKLDEIDPGRFVQFMREIAKLPKDAYAARSLATKKFMDPGNKWLRAVSELRGGLLVWNPLSISANAIGNTLAAASFVVERPLVAAADVALSASRGTPRSRFAGEAKAAMTGMWRGFHDAADLAMTFFKNEGGLAPGLTLESDLPPAIPGAVGKGVRLGFRALGATDQFFSHLLRSAEANAFAYRTARAQGLRGPALDEAVSRLLANPSAQMIDAANSAAREYTYRANLPGIIQDIDRLFRPSPNSGNVGNIIRTMLGTFVPFRKTPANIALFSAERVLPGVAPLRAIGKGGAAMSEAAGRSLLAAAGLMTTSLFLRAVEGRVTGRGPKNKAEREDLYNNNWRPNSVLFPRKDGSVVAVPHSRFEPISTLLRLIAELNDQRINNPQEDFALRSAKAVGLTARGLLDASFLKSLGELARLLEDPEARGKQFFWRYAASWVPPLAAIAARGEDPTVRGPETLTEHLLTRVPRYSKGVRPRVSRFGEDIKRTTKYGGLVDFPGAPDPVAQKLLAMGLSAAVQRTPRRTLGVTMTPDEELAVARISGPIRRILVSRLLDAPGFAQASKSVQEQLLGSAVERADAIAIAKSGLLERGKTRQASLLRGP